MYNDGNQGEPLILELCITNILQRASDMNLKSVSIPAISSGIFKFPKDRCAEVLFDAVLQFNGNNPTSSVKTVRFTNFDEETVDFFKKQFDKRYPNAPRPALPAPAAPAPPPPAAAAGPAPPNFMPVRESLVVRDDLVGLEEASRDEPQLMK